MTVLAEVASVVFGLTAGWAGLVVFGNRRHWRRHFDRADQAWAQQFLDDLNTVRADPDARIPHPDWK